MPYLSSYPSPPPAPLDPLPHASPLNTASQAEFVFEERGEEGRRAEGREGRGAEGRGCMEWKEEGREGEG